MKKLLIILFVLCLCVSAFGQFIPVKMFGQQPSGPFADGLVFYFRGIEAGNVVDESLYKNHGTLIATAHFVGEGVDFDGNSDYIDFGDPDALTFGDGSSDTPFTIVGRVFLRDATDFPILDKLKDVGAGEAEYYFGTNGSDGLRFNIFDNVVSARIARDSSATFTARQNTWICFAGTYDGSGSNTGIKLYADGLLLADTDNNAGAYTAMENLSISAITGATLLDGGSATFGNGIMSHLIVYRRRLSAGEIAELSRNPDLPMQEEPIWQLFSPAAPAAGQVILITKAEQEYGLMLPWLMSEWLYPNPIQ